MIEFNSVYKKYKKQEVLNDLSFKIGNNDLTLLIGRNGSGKTTTIKLILKMLEITKDDSGSIINDFSSISYFPEKFSLPSLMKSHDFLYIYFNGEISKSDIDHYIKRYNLLNKYMCNLSKGMMQKVIIIKTLLEESFLYIFDEPLNGLDDESRLLLKEDINELHKNNKSILISTHEPDFFNDISTKIIRLGETKWKEI